MLQTLQSYDGDSMLMFDQNDILHIRMTLLYSWLTASDFNIDMKAVLGIDPGSNIFFFSCLFIVRLLMPPSKPIFFSFHIEPKHIYK